MEDALISCICVTRNRVALLKRAVHCFLNQTYRPCELIVQYEADDVATRSYLRTLTDPRIVPMEVQALPHLSLGSRRNIAVRDAQGQYVATWDDDDWSAPTRLAEQMGAINQSGRAGCILLQCILFDETRQSALLSASRYWEFSLLALKSAMPAFPELAKGEDSPVVMQMVNAGRMAGLVMPELYIYVYHGANIWDHAHWSNAIELDAQVLDADDCLRFANLLNNFTAL